MDEAQFNDYLTNIIQQKVRYLIEKVNESSPSPLTPSGENLVEYCVVTGFQLGLDTVFGNLETFELVKDGA